MRRAVALASVEGQAYHGLIDSIKPDIRRAQPLETLVFWGHGDAYKLCHKTPGELVDIIKAWKKSNPTLKTVELITCNARHATGKTTSYSKQVKSKLKSGIRSSTRDVKVKALPVTVTGSHDAFSILLAETRTKSWVYVTGPGTNDDVMMEGARLINFHTVNGKTVSFTGDIAARANEVIKAHRLGSGP